MARGTLIRTSDVKPFPVSDAYVSRMLLDHTNSESQRIHVNHGTVAPGGTLLPASAHGTDQDHYDETYYIIKGKCRTRAGRGSAGDRGRRCHFHPRGRHSRSR